MSHWNKEIRRGEEKKKKKHRMIHKISMKLITNLILLF